MRLEFKSYQPILNKIAPIMIRLAGVSGTTHTNQFIAWYDATLSSCTFFVLLFGAHSMNQGRRMIVL